MATQTLTAAADRSLPPCASCSHSASTHDIGTRSGQRVRTRCLHGDGPHGIPCSCRLYRRGEAW